MRHPAVLPSVLAMFCIAAQGGDRAAGSEPAATNSLSQRAAPLRQIDFPLAGKPPAPPETYHWYEYIDGSQMASMSSAAGDFVLLSVQKRLALVDYTAGRVVRSYDLPFAVGSVALSPDAKLAIVQLCEETLNNVNGNCRVVLYDLASGKVVRTFIEKQECPCNSLRMRCSFLDDGKLAFAYNAFMGPMHVWETATGKPVWSEEFSSGVGADAKGTRVVCERLCCAPGDAPTESALLEFPGGKKIASCPALLSWGGEFPLEAPRDVLAVDVPRDPRRLIFAVAEVPPRQSGPSEMVPRSDGYVASIDPSSGKCAFRTDRSGRPRNYGSVTSVAMTRDGRRIVACTKAGLVVLDGDTGAELCRWRPHLRMPVRDRPGDELVFTPLVKVALSPDEKKAIACDFWGRVTVWPTAEAFAAGRP